MKLLRILFDIWKARKRITGLMFSHEPIEIEPIDGWAQYEANPFTEITFTIRNKQ
jgi:hypothetical protein